MFKTTLTSKGQTTIPKNIRDLLQIKTGDRLYFIINHDGYVELRTKKMSIWDLKGILKSRNRRKKGVTIEEMNRGLVKGVTRGYR